jgi:tripartite-type tricarboxylate transporter receptor subunit TctC
LQYDALRDFAPISQIGFGPQVLIVNNSLPVKGVSDLLALARAKPGQLSYASGGIGTSQHLTGELFKSVGHVDILHVPYKGGAPALVDIIGGRVAFMFINTLEALPHAKAGKVKILAIANEKRSGVFPDTPTFAESGMPGFESLTWWGLVAPAGTPKPVIGRLHRETVKALAAPDVIERFAALGAEILASTPEQFGAFMRAEAKKWGGVVKSTGIKAE